MIKVAVLDDSEEDRTQLDRYLQRFQEEQGIQMQVKTYGNSLEFLEANRGGYHVVLLDVEMPGMDGIEVAREIRRTDEITGIIFITNMAQYAIQGYEVNAIDFMVKPVQYYNFAEKMKKAVGYARKRQGKYILLNGEDGIMRILDSDIYYLEKDKNYLVYHTGRGNFRERGTMQSAKEKLGTAHFAECTSGCLVNLAYVEKVGKDSIGLGFGELPLSRRMRREFLQSFMEYAGGGY